MSGLTMDQLALLSLVPLTVLALLVIYFTQASLRACEQKSSSSASLSETASMRRSQSRVEEQTDQLIRVRDLALPLLAVNRVVGGVAEPESHETI